MTLFPKGIPRLAPAGYYEHIASVYSVQDGSYCRIMIVPVQKTNYKIFDKYKTVVREGKIEGNEILQ